MLDLVIIGAGISGLRAATRAQALGLDYQIVEARDRVGGRAYAEAGLDLGPSWVWPAHQPRVRALIEALGLRVFAQPERGALRYETPAGVQTLDFPKRYADAARLEGGPYELARRLAKALPPDRLALNAHVHEIALAGEGVEVRIANGQGIQARHVILAAPPPLIAGWSFSPLLPDTLKAALTRWPTWMAAHAKISLRYDAPFWREAGLSGSAVSQVGPLMEVVDHSDDEAGRFALFGFYGWPHGVRRRRAETLQAETLSQLERLFGAEAGRPVEIVFKDWASDPLTATPADSPGPREHPPYGEPALSQTWLEGRLAFAGAEASQGHGGLIEGALEAADAAMERLFPASA